MAEVGKLYYYDPESWEFTSSDKSHVIEANEDSPNPIIEIGVLKKMSSIFRIEIYDEEADEYKELEFSTRAEAEAHLKAVAEAQQ